jgi:hypothetical protein
MDRSEKIFPIEKAGFAILRVRQYFAFIAVKRKVTETAA